MSLTIICITGASGSGKTTTARDLMKYYVELGKACYLISVDSYYRANPPQGADFDHPDSVELDLLNEHLMKLKRGEPIHVPTYCFVTSNRKSETVEIRPIENMILIIEGIFALNARLMPAIHDALKIYINTPTDLCAVRRLVRDYTERGQTDLKSSLQYYENNVHRNLHYIERTRETADLILDSTTETHRIENIKCIDEIMNTTRFGSGSSYSAIFFKVKHKDAATQTVKEEKLSVA